MTFTGIRHQGQSPSKACQITVGNALNGDTVRDCDILDPGDGSGVYAAVQRAYDNEFDTVVSVREGTYTFTPASAFTTRGCNVRGVDKARVTFVCPSQAGYSQNVCVISDGDTIGGVTFRLVANPTAVAAAGSPRRGVALENGGTLEDFAFEFDGSAGASQTSSCIGRSMSESPDRIAIRNGTIAMTDPGGQGAVSLSSLSATFAVPGHCLVENVAIVATGEDGPTANTTGVSVSGIATVRNVSCVGLPKAVRFAASYIAGAESLPTFEIDAIHSDNAGLDYQSPVEIILVSSVDSTIDNVRIANVTTNSDNTVAGGNVSAYGLSLTLTGLVATNWTIDGFGFVGESTTKGFVRVSSTGDSVIDRMSILNVKTPGTVQAVVANPSTVPFTHLTLDDVNANVIDINNYANDTSIGAGSANSITIGNGALRTCVGAEMQCASITDNGTGTLVAPRTHVSTAAVAVTNDITEGFRPGDYWLQTVGPVLSVCSDNTDGAAVWTAI